jgi:hypothetical protein
VIRVLAMGVKEVSGLHGPIGHLGFGWCSGWKHAGSKQTWQVLWRLALQQLCSMIGWQDTIHLSISPGGRDNSLSIEVSNRSLSEASISGSYLYSPSSSMVLAAAYSEDSPLMVPADS